MATNTVNTAPTLTRDYDATLKSVQTDSNDAAKVKQDLLKGLVQAAQDGGPTTFDAYKSALLQEAPSSSVGIDSSSLKDLLSADAPSSQEISDALTQAGFGGGGSSGNSGSGGGSQIY